jgi:hypothetical protein
MATAPRCFSFQRACKKDPPVLHGGHDFAAVSKSLKTRRFSLQTKSLSQELVAKILDPFHFNEPTNERPSGSLETLKGVRYKSRFENLSHFNAPPSIERPSGSHLQRP